MIDQLSKALSFGRVSVICGAGISANSGIPVVAPLIDHILDCVEHKWRDEIHADQAKEADSTLVPTKEEVTEGIRFETFIQLLLGGTMPEGHEDLFRIYEAPRPNFNHRFIARMARLGLLLDIYTTNFDTLLERAMVEEGVRFGAEWQVYRDPALAVGRSDAVGRIVKLHGSVDDTTSLRTTLRAISTEIHVRNTRPLIRHLFERRHADDIVLALGYSFSDDLDINPVLREDLNNHTKFLVIVKHTEKDCTKLEALDLMNHEKRAAFVNLNGSLITYDTARFVRCLWQHPCVQRYCQTSSAQIMSFWETHQQMSEGYRSAGVWQAAVKKWAKGLRAADLTLAAVWHRLGDYEKMQRLAMAALSRSHRAGDVAVHGLAGLMLAEASIKLGKPAEAEKIARKTLRFAETVGASETMAAAFHLLTLAQAEQGDHSRVLSWINRFVKHVTGGDRWSATNLANRAVFLSRQGHDRKAIKILKRVVLERRRQGQPEEMACALRNLAVGYHRLGAHAKAAAVFEEAARVYQTLCNQAAADACVAQAQQEYITFEKSR